MTEKNYFEGGMQMSKAAIHSITQLRCIKRGLCASTALLSSLCFSQAVVAAEDDDVIIVTAQKREQALQDVPLSITALTEGFLQDAGIDNLADYARRVPGLAYVDVGPVGFRGSRGVNLRGVVPTAGPASVGFYIGETPVAVNNPRLFDINRIEVLRGPQGTLYGRNSMGGTVKIVPNRPNSNEFEANIDGTISYTEHGGANYIANGMINIPLVKDKAAFRAVVYGRAIEGFIDNIPRTPAPAVVSPDTATELPNHNDEDTFGLRAAIEFKPTDRLTITPSVFLQQTDIDAPPTVFDDLGDLQSQFLVAPKAEEDFVLTALEIAYDFGSVQFISSSSYYDYSQEGVEDLTELVNSIIPTGLFPAPFQIRATNKQFVQEVRLSSSTDSPFQWLIGGFFSDEDKTSLFFSQPAGIAAASVFPPAIPGDLLGNASGTSGPREFAAFGELSYALVDNLTFTAGLRWFDIEFGSETTQEGFFFGPLSTNSVSGSNDGFTPRFNLSYQVSDDILVYGNVAKGFRQGVPNPALPAVCGPSLAALGLTSTPVQSESDSLWSYEAGAKTSFLDNRVTVNGAAFYIDWSDIQQGVFLPACSFSFTDNLGEATSKGFELEIAGELIESLDVTLGTSYIDATLDRDFITGTGSEGDRLLDTPEWTLTASAHYTFPINEQFSGFVRGDFSYTGSKKTTFVPASPETSDRPAYEIADFRVGVVADDWQASLFVTNAFDERPRLGLTNFGRVPGGPTRVTTTPPRTWGVNIKKSF